MERASALRWRESASQQNMMVIILAEAAALTDSASPEVVEMFTPERAVVVPQCCWSAWGGEAACGGYPASFSGGACNTDWARACFANGDCPLPTLATAVPDLRPSLPAAAFQQFQTRR